MMHLMVKGLIVHNVNRHVRSRTIKNKQIIQYVDKWKINLIRNGTNPHVSLKAPLYSFYTIGQFRKLHRQFTHTSAIKDLLSPENICPLSSDTERSSEIGIHVPAFGSLQKIWTALKCYHASIGADNACFNVKVYIFLMHIEESPVTHMVDYATNFSAPQFEDQSDNIIFLDHETYIWASVYSVF